jgi:outer membrane protein assembly factor BamB
VGHGDRCNHALRQVTFTALMVGLAACSTSGPDRGAQHLVFDRTDATFLVGEPRTGGCTFPYRSQISSFDSADGSMRWVQEIPWSEPPSVAVRGDRAFVWTSRLPNGYASVVAVDLTTGRPLWQHEVWGQPRYDRFAEVAGTSVVILDDDELLALGAEDGGVRWREPVGDLGAFAITTDVVVATDEDGALTAFEGSSGREIWSRSSEGSGGPVGPVIADDIVIGGAQEGAIVGLDLGSGRELWRAPSPPGRFWYQVGEPAAGVLAVVSDNVPGIQVTERRPELTALSIATGERLWSRPGSGEVLIAYDDLLFEIGAGRVTASDISTGEERWRIDEEVRSVSRPSADLLLVDLWGRQVLRSVDPADGSVRWQRPMEGAVLTTALVDGQLLVGSALSGANQFDDRSVGRLHALEVETGTAIWSTATRDAAGATESDGRGSTLVVSSDLALFCD